MGAKLGQKGHAIEKCGEGDIHHSGGSSGAILARVPVSCFSFFVAIFAGEVVMTRKFAAAIIFIFVISAAPSKAWAATVYTYTGNNFTSIIDNTPPNGSYTTSMSVTGSFTLQDPLAPNLLLTNITPNVLNFSFFDGRNTITNLNDLASTFQFSTDALGNITAWNIALTALQNSQTWLITTASSLDFGRIIESGSNDQGQILGTPGSWSVSDTSVVPLPAALPLFAGGLGALGLLGWCRKRKSTAAIAS